MTKHKIYNEYIVIPIFLVFFILIGHVFKYFVNFSSSGNEVFDTQVDSNNYQSFNSSEGFQDPGVSEDNQLFLLRESLPKDMLVISAVVNEEDLHGQERGILTNNLEVGREWERLSYINIYDDQQLKLTTAAGIRLHGDFSRRRKLLNFRFYMRSSYGKKYIDPGIVFDGGGRLYRFVVRQDPTWYSMSTLLTNYAIKAGFKIPNTRPALFYLNGELLGLYSVSEHIGRRQWEQYLNHNHYVYDRIKGEDELENIEVLREFESWAQNRSRKITFEEAYEKVDLIAMTRYLFFVMYMDMQDWQQGAVFLDLKDPDAKWQWVLWDLDGAFKESWNKDSDGNPLVVDPIRELLLPWEEGSINWSLYAGDSRQLLFNQLFFDARYKAFFVNLAIRMMNHELPQAYLRSVLKSEVDLVLESNILSENEREWYIGISEAIERNLPGRYKLMIDTLTKYFNAGQAIAVKVLPNSDQFSYQIDGFNKKGGFGGVYFEGMYVHLKIPKEYRRNFSHWLVNGQKVQKHEWGLRLTRPTTIQPIYLTP